MFSCKICKISKSNFFYRRFPVAASEVLLVFSKEFREKTGATVSNKYHIQLKKKYLLLQKYRSSHRRCFVNEGLQGPAQVFSYEYCKIFKTTYFEKHLWMAASENRHLNDYLPKGGNSWILLSF